jgi:hypothetical protein
MDEDEELPYELDDGWFDSGNYAYYAGAVYPTQGTHPNPQFYASGESFTSTTKLNLT